MGRGLRGIAGGIDLSVTSTIALASVIGAKAMTADGGWLAGSPLAAPVAVATMLVLGLLVGALNGGAITRLRMPAFIVTLTAMMFVSGLAIWLTQSKNIGRLPDSFTVLGGNTWIALGIVLAAAAVVHLGLGRSLFGRWLYAVGHNPRAPRTSPAFQLRV